MGLFDQVLGAMNSSDREANPDQLSSILGAFQQLSGSQGINASQSQTMMSMVGQFVRSSLQDKRSSEGGAQVESLVNRFAGTQPNPTAVDALFPPAQQQQVSQSIAQRTGLDPTMVQSFLPMVVPVVLNFLKTGSSTGSQPTSSQSNPGQSSGNPVLNAFLDADGDGDVDMGDMMNQASRFMGQR